MPKEVDAATSTGPGQHYEGTTSVHKKHPRATIPQAPGNISESIMLEGHHIQGRRGKGNIHRARAKQSIRLQGQAIPAGQRIGTHTNQDQAIL